MNTSNAKANRHVHWIGPAYEATGYGNVSRSYIKALVAAGYAVSLGVICNDHRTRLTTYDVELLDRLPRTPAGRPLNVIHGLATWFKDLVNATAWRNIGVTIFETDSIPWEWRAGSEVVDEVWVPSEFNIKTFSAGGIDSTKLRKVHYGIDVWRWPVCPKPAQPPFRFLYVADHGWRKGHQLLIDAYCSAFTSTDDCQLCLKVPADWVLNLDLKGRSDIELVIADLTEADIAGLYARSHAYVSTDRANGWGMPVMEAMCCGLPCATINWSGSTEFTSHWNAYLIEPERTADLKPIMEPVDPRLVDWCCLYRDQRWPVVTVEAVAAVLRTMKSGQGQVFLSVHGAAHIRSHYSIGALVPKLSAAIDANFTLAGAD